MDFMKKAYGYDLERSIKCSNYIGVTIDMAVELGFRKLLMVGHVGKLVKVAGGIMNTHSKEADARMEILPSMCVKRKCRGRDSTGDACVCHNRGSVAGFKKKFSI